MPRSEWVGQSVFRQEAGPLAAWPTPDNGDLLVGLRGPAVCECRNKNGGRRRWPPRGV